MKTFIQILFILVAVMAIIACGDALEGTEAILKKEVIEKIKNPLNKTSNIEVKNNNKEQVLIEKKNYKSDILSKMDPIQDSLIKDIWIFDDVSKMVKFKLILKENIKIIPENLFYEFIYEVENISSKKNYLYEIVLQEGLITISDNSFTGNNLKKVTIPSSVTTIRDGAFSSNYINDLTFSKNSQLKHIGNYAFESSGLNEIAIPETVDYLGHNVFYQNKNLKKIIMKKSLYLKILSKGKDKETSLKNMFGYTNDDFEEVLPIGMTIVDYNQNILFTNKK